MTTRKFLTILLFAASLFLLSACNLPAANTPGQSEPNVIYTAAAQTVAAQLTQSVSEVLKPTVMPPGATATQPAPTATNTSAPPATQDPTSAPTATRKSSTAAPVPCNQAEFIKDVNYTDGTEVDPGTVFDKIWRIKNTGSCTWTSSYSVVFDEGDALKGPASVQLTNGKVTPGSTVDITVENLKAPDKSGTYQGFWMLRDGDGEVFGIGSNNKSFWVKIVVENPVSYDFLAKAKNAEWHNATKTFTFGDREDDDLGIAAYGEDIKLEDGKTYNKVLGTYPERIEDGVIYGVFTDYTVEDGDHFRAEVGFRSNCDGAKVIFKLMYMDGDELTTLETWKKSCNGELLTLDYDLSDYEGETMHFVLGVDLAGDFRNNKAIWVDPRIQK